MYQARGTLKEPAKAVLEHQEDAERQIANNDLALEALGFGARHPYFKKKDTEFLHLLYSYS